MDFVAALLPESLWVFALVGLVTTASYAEWRRAAPAREQAAAYPLVVPLSLCLFVLAAALCMHALRAAPRSPAWLLGLLGALSALTCTLTALAAYAGRRPARGRLPVPPREPATGATIATAHESDTPLEGE